MNARADVKMVILTIFRLFKLVFSHQSIQVANARGLAFFSLLFFFGVEWGTEQTFYYVYAKEQLGATVSLIGVMGAANPVTALIM